ncbi:MAG: prepilin-type N-terminal cleavage/methylation domain-containing protein [Rhodoferax sp.]
MTRSRRAGGFTLIELLVAIAVMALMAGLAWRGLDGMLRSRAQVQAHSEQLQALQTGLAQWTTDLDALLPLPDTPALDWDGRALRLTRRSASDPGIVVVAWTRRADEGGQWLRWQSQPLQTRGELQDAWLRAAQWAQNPSTAERRFEVTVLPLLQWQVFYFRADAWTNPLSSANSTLAAPNAAAPADNGLPEGVRLVLTLPEGYAVTGTLTRDWVRLNAAGGKS